MDQVAMRSQRKRRIDAAAWAAFLIWIGVAILVDIAWGSFLIGVGLVILSAESATALSKEKFDWFWALCGAACLAGGVAESFDLSWRIGPILVILLGFGFLLQAVFGTRYAGL